MSSLPHLAFKTDSRISEIPVSTEQIIKIIKNINPNKAHGFDDISVKMIKLFPELLASPLKLIFQKFYRKDLSLTHGKRPMFNQYIKR